MLHHIVIYSSVRLTIYHLCIDSMDKGIRVKNFYPCIIHLYFLSSAGETRSERSEVNLEFTFDVFVCVAILTMNSNDICKASDAAGICLNG